MNTLTTTPRATCSTGHEHLSKANALACDSDTCPTCWGVGATSRGTCGRCAGRGTYGGAA